MLLLLKHAAHFSGCTFAHTARQTDLVGDACGFAIGWSSVSVASANTMHLVMSTEK